ncbi:MAG: phosphoribosylamine--glycine ligase [Gemmatimonadota bacterium]|nr:phosphoribosylamine--glycine ligase [Gemmatimonadota bacterium]
MRALIIGNGGREHALAWKLHQEEPRLEILAAPGNPGIAEFAECVPMRPTDTVALEGLAKERSVHLTIVGPEAPLAAGLVDRFQAAGLPIFGPTKAAAEIETSKAFAKQLMLEDGIPTARAEMHRSSKAAKAAVRRFGTPVVIKASGLAAGKGVIVCSTIGDADRTVDEMLEGNRFGEAGAEVLVEEFMEGEELSVFVITNGAEFITFPGLQDHKRLLDHDEGPNTGGMGAYVPVTLGAWQYDEAVHSIIQRTLRGMAARSRPFTGLLYAGLMMNADGPRVVEFNCRFGDPETQALLPVLRDVRLLDLMLAVARGEPLPSVDARAAGACVTTVLAAANYPDIPRPGDDIELPPPQEGIHVFHAGTVRAEDGRLITNGGRVLSVSAVGANVAEAQARSMEYARRIRFAGKQMRTDIGWREIARERNRGDAGASRD